MASHPRHHAVNQTNHMDLERLARMERLACGHPLEAAIQLLDLEGCAPHFQPVTGADPARDAEVLFRRDGFVFLLRAFANDPEFVQLVLPSFHESEDADVHAVALTCADRVNARTKCARLFSPQGKEFWGTVDFLVADRAHTLPVLLRACSTLAEAVRAFRVLMSMR